MSVKIESVDTRGGWLLNATFNDSAILEALETYCGVEGAGYDIDAIQSVDETNVALEQAIFDYCFNLRRIMNNMLGNASYRGEDADDEMVQEWVELTNIVEKLLDKIKN